MKRAEERAKALVRQEEITKTAQRQANEMLATAQLRSKEMRQAANDYADSVLKDAEEILSTSLGDVKSTRQQIRQRRSV